MKKWFLYMGVAIITCSCNGLVSLPQKSLPSVSYASYCELLNVPSKAYSTAQPKPYLGIYLDSEKIERAVQGCKKNTMFVRVAGVMNGTPASKAGLMKDDIIESFNGSPTCGDAGHVLPDFRKVVEQQTIGSHVNMNILRGSRSLSLTATLEEMPTHIQDEASHPEIGKCSGQVSRLETTLRAQNALPAFDNVLGALYEKSNAVHNPGSSYEKDSYPLQLKEMTYMMRHPLSAGAAATELSKKIISPLRGNNWSVGALMQNAASLLDIDLSPSERPAEISFPALLDAMGRTKRRIEEALGNLTREEKILLQEKAINPWEDGKWNTILDVSMKVDRAKLFNAFSPLFSFLSHDNLMLLKKDLVKRFGKIKDPILYEAMTPIGKVIVGGPGPNVYSEDAALILDLGGDDLYLNNAGGTRPGMPLALVIDWGGDNRYISKENFSQGAGVLGGGFLIDLGGNSTFLSLDGSQGAGFWGIGFLYHGNGDGVYNARKFSQGTGEMGIGLIVNEQGDDRYLCSYGGQGLGLFGGAGIFIDEAGNDFYQLGGLEPDFRDPIKATVSMGQGFGYGIRPEKENHGVPGGIGMLVDEKGDDTYIADYFAQGASYYYGLGILSDMGGNDQYISGRYSQGAGIHSSVGVLIDRGGKDFYYASLGVAQGMGHDFGVGFFDHDGGDGRYWGGTLVQGAATNGSLGIFIGTHTEDQRTFFSKGQGYAEEENSMGITIVKGKAGELSLKVGVRKE